MIPSVFENKKLRVEYISNEEKYLRSGKYKFKVYIKDFDTPSIAIEYDDSSDVIERTWIEDDGIENEPKGNVVYKLFSLIEYEVLDILKFLIKHN